MYVDISAISGSAISLFGQSFLSFFLVYYLFFFLLSFVSLLYCYLPRIALLIVGNITVNIVYIE